MRRQRRWKRVSLYISCQIIPPQSSHRCSFLEKQCRKKVNIPHLSLVCHLLTIYSLTIMDSAMGLVKTILPASSSPKALPTSQFSHHYNLKSLAIAANRTDLLGRDAEEKAAIHQWTELAVRHLISSPTFDARELAEELNACLASRSLLVSHRLTLADVVMFAATHAYFAAISFQEKERLRDASRWFAHVQNCLRETNSAKLDQVTFIRNRLYQLCV